MKLVKQYIFFLSLCFCLHASPPPFLLTSNGWAEKTLNSLTLREKIGQLFIVAAASNFNQPTEALTSSLFSCPYRMDQEYIVSLISDYHIGGIIFLYKSDPETQIALIKKFQNKTTIPLLIAQDCEWGLSMRLDRDPSKVVQYPRNLALGAFKDEELIYQLGYEIGKQCAAIGVHMNLAPVADVNTNPQNPVIRDRSFGDDPEKVARLSLLYARGLQDAGVLACAKHFPGHGDTSVDSHLDLPILLHDQERLNSVELLPFKVVINNGISSVMNAHLAVPAFEPELNKPSSMSFTIVTELLKNKLGFKGLVITDGLGMQAITKNYRAGELELYAFLAGNDLLLCPLDVAKAVVHIENAINNGQITEHELNERVLKILKAKEWVFAQQQNIDLNTSFLIRAEAYELQKKLYAHAALDK